MARAKPGSNRTNRADKSPSTHPNDASSEHKSTANDSKASSSTGISLAPVIFVIWLAVTTYAFFHLRLQKDAAVAQESEWATTKGVINVIPGFHNPEDIGVVGVNDNVHVVLTGSIHPVIGGRDESDKLGVYAMRVEGRGAKREDFGKPVIVWAPHEIKSDKEKKERKDEEKEQEDQKKVEEEEHVPTFGTRTCREPRNVEMANLRGLKVKKLADGTVRLALILDAGNDRQSIEFFNVSFADSTAEKPATLKWVGCILAPPHLNGIDFDEEEGRYVFATEMYGDTPDAGLKTVLLSAFNATPGRLYMFDTKEEAPAPKVLDNTAHARLANGIVLIQSPTEWRVVYTETFGNLICTITLRPPDRTQVLPDLDVVPTMDKTCAKVAGNPDNLSYDRATKTVHVAAMQNSFQIAECLVLGFMRWQPYCHVGWQRLEFDPFASKVVHESDVDKAERIGSVSSVVRDANGKCFYLSAVIGNRIGHFCP